MPPCGGSIVLACLLAASARAEGTLALVAEAPCAMFLEGEPLRFTVKGDELPALLFRVLDEREATVGEGRSEGRAIELAPLGKGWYELRWEAAGVKGATAFAVVASRPDEPPADGPVCVDVAGAWLARPDQWTPIARMLRRIGIGTVRERLSWGAVQPEPGKTDWLQYETVADALAAAGVREYQILHDSPGWTHPGRDTRSPDDLRDVYRFCKEAASHFRGRIIAWEPWNEPDISFFDRLGDRMAAIQKAAYLGAKAGNPETRVLQVSLCRGRSPFSDNLYECGIAAYTDAFNFHTYDDIRQYPTTIASWVGLTAAYGVAELPIWLTEAGIRTPFTEEGRELPLETERVQAEFVPKSFAISLAGGVDKHFFFVLPYYPEGAIQFGALHEDLSPRLAAVALATTAHVLGAGRYVGRLACEGAGVEAPLFDTGQGLAAVVWSEVEVEARLPVGARAVRVVDYLGREREVASDAAGNVALRVGSVPQFVVGLADSARSHLAALPVRAPGAWRVSKPSPIVVAGWFRDLPVDKGADNSVVPAGQASPFIVEVVNLSETTPARGTVRLALPEGWTADRTSADVDLPAMGRAEMTIQVTPHPGDPLVPAVVTVTGEFGAEQMAPSVSRVALDLTRAVAVEERLLEGADDPALWKPNISGNGTVVTEKGPEGGVIHRIRFTQPGDRWCYPTLTLPEPRDLSGWNALRFEYRLSTSAPETLVRAQLVEEGGSLYCSPARPATTEWKDTTFPFRDLTWGVYSPADPDGRLDLDKITALLLGLNTPSDDLTLEVRNLRLARF